MRVAVLGAGMLGTCISLELSKRDIYVDLYDREEACITQAGGRNEGKIHLGFVYGADFSFKTADKMLSGGLEFYPLMRRWVGQELDSVPVSSPFIYVIDPGSQLSLTQIEDHFTRLDAEIQKDPTADYPGGFLNRTEKLSAAEASKFFNPDRVLAAYRTPERSIDIRKLASILRKKIKESKFTTFYPHSELKSVSVQGEIEYTGPNGTHKKNYDAVINVLWDGRLALDEQVGLPDEPPWTYRIKHAIFLKSLDVDDIPSTTIIQGAYGDLVHFGQGSFYLSWYPTCMRGFIKNVISAPRWNRNLPPDEAREMIVDTLAHLSQYIPALKNIKNITDPSALGGLIYAHGKTDIIDPKSGLHNRYQVTIKSKGNYYSINPGKYSLCPYFAYQAADQICSSPLRYPSLSSC